METDAPLSDKYLRVLVSSATDIPVDGTSSSSGYVRVTHGEHRGMTHIVSLTTPLTFNTEFSFPFSVDTPIEFEVFDSSSNKCLAEGVRYTDAGYVDSITPEGEKMRFSFPWKGAIQLHPQGKLEVLADLIDKPRNPPTRAATVVQCGTGFSENSPKEAAVTVRLDDKSQTTGFATRDGSGNFVWKEAFVFNYANEHILSFEVYGKDNKTSTYAMAQYDLWTMQLDKTLKTSGDLVVTDSSNAVLGRLQVSIRLWNPEEEERMEKAACQETDVSEDSQKKKIASQEPLDVKEKQTEKAAGQEVQKLEAKQVPQPAKETSTATKETGIGIKEPDAAIPNTAGTSNMPAITARLLLFKAATAAHEARRAAIAAAAVAEVYQTETAYRSVSEANAAAEKAEKASQSCDTEVFRWTPLSSITESSLASLALLVNVAKKQKATAKAALQRAADEDGDASSDVSGYIFTDGELTARSWDARCSTARYSTMQRSASIPATPIPNDSKQPGYKTEYRIPIIPWRRPASTAPATDALCARNPGKTTRGTGLLSPEVKASRDDGIDKTEQRFSGSSAMDQLAGGRLNEFGLHDDDLPCLTCCGFKWKASK